MRGSGKRSRRRSATSSRSRRAEPPEQVVFFVDRCLGRHRFPAPLRAAGLRIEIHDDHFPPEVEDRIWLAEVGARGWIAITKDERIRYRTIERRAMLEAGARAFVLIGRSVPAADLGAMFVRALPRVWRFLEKNPAPFIARIGRNGTVEMVVRAERRKRRRGMQRDALSRRT